ncbi:hypothetical protein GCK32_009735 [Trichostrongylus colubriformis]|uniref:tRNA/rRNA methyltransferase SpoU type domain-containing protein n=1 Tax=Trichostrongylus colubriformis TaxID=6319 RepID=A0AAN8FL72_TRICO
MHGVYRVFIVKRLSNCSSYVLTQSMVHLPNILPSITRRASTSNGSIDTSRPNLVFRKAKVLGKSVEDLRSLNVPVPKFRGEAVFGIYPVREALAAGKRTFFALYIKDSVRPSRITPSMSKASCGALETFTVARVPSFMHLHKALKSVGASFVGTSDASSAPRYGKPVIELKNLKIRPEEKIVVVLGKFFIFQCDEGAGISEEVVNSCDKLLTITSTSTKRTGVNSLNVSVVAGILLHHIAMARRSQ